MNLLVVLPLFTACTALRDDVRVRVEAPDVATVNVDVMVYDYGSHSLTTAKTNVMDWLRGAQAAVMPGSSVSGKAMPAGSDAERASTIDKRRVLPLEEQEVSDE